MNHKSAMIGFLVLVVALLCVGAGAWPRPANTARPDITIRADAFHEILKLFVGRKCIAVRNEIGWVLTFSGGKHRYKLEMLGDDFLQIATESRKIYIPFSAISHVDAR